MRSIVGTTCRVMGSPLVMALVLLFTLVSFKGAEAVSLYIVPDVGTNISGAVTTNLRSGNTSPTNSTWITLFSPSSPSAGDTRMIYEYPKSSSNIIGRVFYKNSFATDAHISPGAVGTFWVKSTRADNEFEFSLWEYNPSTGTYVEQIGSTIKTAVGTTAVKKVDVAFANANYTLNPGNYLAVQIWYHNLSTRNKHTASVYCNSSYPSKIDAGITFSMSATADTNSSITSSGMTTAANSTVIVYDPYNGNRTYTVNANTGYEIINVYHDKNGSATNTGPVLNGTQFTFDPIVRSHIINVTTNTATLKNIIISQDAGGHVVQGADDCTSPSCTFKRYNGPYTFDFTPNAGYSVYGITIDGTPYPVPGGQTTTYSIPITINKPETYISVDFEPFVTVTSSADPGGTINPSGTTAVPRGGALTFNITPDGGYVIDSIKDNGVDKGNTSPYTITDIQTAHIVKVTFRAIHTINASSGPNGNISPVGSTSVNAGASQTFTMLGNAGYIVSNVLVDGVSVGALSTYTFTNVADDHTIAVTFAAAPVPSTYCAIPPFVASSAPPNVMLMLSVETPMQGPANVTTSCTGSPSDINYTCDSVSGGCGNGALGCYDNAQEYYGYFDSGKCYTYSSNLFSPSGAATSHQCTAGTAWSGNFLNWATTMAVDAFRKAFTGGNRDTDDASSTVILAARHDSDWYPDMIRIDNAEKYIPVSGTGVTRYLRRPGTGMGFVLCKAGVSDASSCKFSTSGTGETRFPTVGADSDQGAAAYRLRIKACDTTGGVETRCNTANNKPEGTIQKYMDKIRFSLISYAADNAENRDGGVLRSNMKWIGPTIPYGLRYHDGSGTIQTCNTSSGCANPVLEVKSDGTFKDNPDGATGANSGIINYINKFAYASGYKSHDPMGEMFYEVVRYFMNLKPSAANRFCTDLSDFTAGYADGFAFHCNSSKTEKWGWRDPSLYYCSQNYVIAINDANPWLDKRIPGSAFKADYGGTAAYGDWCGSSACDSDFLLNGSQVDVETWTNKVGDNEGLTGISFGGASRQFGCEVDASGVCIGGFNSDGKSITLGKLGRIVGTPPWPGKENSYNVAGLAYFAHMNDLRPDLNHCSLTRTTTCTADANCPSGEACVIGLRNLTTYMIDTQEPATNMLVGPMNMLYLAAKYGGFEDKDNDQSITIGGKKFNSPYTKRISAAVTPPPYGSYSVISNPLNSEWGTGINGTGNPDTYFFASKAALVESSLNKAFSSILNRASSGTAAAVANNKSGERGANIIQALFYPQWPNDKNIKWLGEVQALWYYLDPIINYSGIYEDSDSDHELEINIDLPPGNDPFVTHALWKAGVQLHKRTASTRSIYTLLDASVPDLTNSVNAFTTGKASTLKPLMNLGALTDAQTDALVTYLRGTDGGAYRSRTVTHEAVTGCWKLGDVINSTPQVQSAVPTNSFNQTYSDGTYTSFIGSSQYKSNNMVYTGSNDGMMHAFKLGLVQKITDSTKPFRIAGVVDTTDLGKEQWAFIPRNALPYLQNQAEQNYCHQYLVDGPPLVFDASLNRHTECVSGNYWECTRQTKLVGGAGPDKNDYVPGKTSWRSVLIGSMGLGGASRNGNCNETLSHDADLTNNADCVKTPVASGGFSSFFALDVTNPLSPKHLWEFSDAVLPAADKQCEVAPSVYTYCGLGLTTPGVAVVRINASGDTYKKSNGRWFAVFASGPTGTIDTATRQFLGRSDQNLRIFVVDINASNSEMVASLTAPTFTKNTNYWIFEPNGSDGKPLTYAFANSLSGAAIDLDRSSSDLPGYYSDDVVYITYTKATLDADKYPVDWNQGGVVRLVTNNDPNPANWFVSTLVDSTPTKPVGPITTSIGKLQDRINKKLWIYFGEGRYFYQADTMNNTRRIFGVADPCYNYDISHINTLSTTAANCPSIDVDTSLFKDMTSTPAATLTTEKGWYITLDAATGTSGAERVVSDVSASTNGIVFYTTFVPDSDLCVAGGTTSLWAVKYNTGGTPPSGGLKGKAPLQTSSGGITMVDLGTAFTQKGGRKLDATLSPPGMAPKGRFPPLLQPKPVKKILNIQEH